MRLRRATMRGVQWHCGTVDADQLEDIGFYDILGSDGKKDEPVQRTGRRRRAAQQVEAPKPDEDSAKKDALVTDPLGASPRSA